MASTSAVTTEGLEQRAQPLLERELERFEREHPRSRELAARAHESLLAGVPMHWMVRWPGGFPVFAAEASGARFRDVDVHTAVFGEAVRELTGA